MKFLTISAIIISLVFLAGKPDIHEWRGAGRTIADSLHQGTGSVIAADNMLYYYNQKGDMNLASINDGKMTRISSFRI